MGGALTGRGFNVGIIDDPTKGRKEADSRGYLDDQWTFYKGTFIDRQEPGAGILVMSTRWAVNDMTGRLLEEMGLEDEDVDKWRVLSIAAQAEPGMPDPLGRQPGEFLVGRFSEAQWRRRKANTPEREWLAKYQQRPAPAEGAIFHPYEQFLFTPPPLEEDEATPYRGPRFAFTDNSYARNRQSDFSVIGVFQLEPPRLDKNGIRRPTIGLLDLYRGRYQFPELKRVARDARALHGFWSLTIEDYGAGTSLIQEFMRDPQGMTIGKWRPDRDKLARAHAATDIIHDYVIRLPDTNTFPSGLPVRAFLQEMANFQGTGDEHDDMVDVFTMAMILIGVKDGGRRRQLRSFGYEFASG